MKYNILLLIVATLLFSCQKQEPKLDITWELIDNLVNEEGESLWQLTLSNKSEVDLPPKGWALYYNNILGAKTDPISGLTIEHVNGDLKAIKPTENFKGIKKGTSFQFSILSSGSVLNFTDAPMGFYLVYDQSNDKGIPCTLKLKKIQQTNLKRSAEEILPTQTAKVEYYKNSNKHPIKQENKSKIIPTPKSITNYYGSYTIKDKLSIYFSDKFENEAKFLKTKLAMLFSGEISFLNTPNADINIIVSANSLKEEAYILNIDDDGILIHVSNTKGAFYAVQSLLALMPINTWESAQTKIDLNKVKIKDEPRFTYRGLFLDVARNFQKKEHVLKILDAMAFYKLNKFHFHICDDEGWRVEIKDLPELTEFGAFRGYSPNESKYLYPSFGSGPNPDPSISHGSGYYSREDFIEILKYANDRHIEVIPEIDMPGHARAAIRSMQVRYDKYTTMGNSEKASEYLLSDFNDKSKYQSVQGWTDNVIDVSKESTYKFLAKVTDEMISMYKEANATLTTIHTGGDEVPHGVWKDSPSCKKLIDENEKYNSSEDLSLYFIDRFSNLLTERNLIAAGWEEIALLHGKEIKPNPEFVEKNLQPMVWNNMWNSGAEDIGYKLANAGYPIVLAHVTNFYFDLAYNKHPEEPGYYWGNFIDTKTPWEYTPMDITKCAEQDRYGNPIDRKTIQQNTIKLSKKGKGNVLGIQAVLWSENNLGQERMEYFYFPKVLGLAERAWAQQPQWASIENDKLRNEQKALAWDKFTTTAGQFDLPRLDYMNGGYAYRISPPGAIIKDGLLHANVCYTGLEIRYTTDGSEPNAESKQYTKEVKVQGSIKLKSFTSNGRSSRSVIVE